MVLQPVPQLLVLGPVELVQRGPDLSQVRALPHGRILLLPLPAGPGLALPGLLRRHVHPLVVRMNGHGALEADLGMPVVTWPPVGTGHRIRAGGVDAAEPGLLAARRAVRRVGEPAPGGLLGLGVRLAALPGGHADSGVHSCLPAVLVQAQLVGQLAQVLVRRDYPARPAQRAGLQRLLQREHGLAPVRLDQLVVAPGDACGQLQLVRRDLAPEAKSTAVSG